MAHEITENDGLVLAGSQAWHGLGIVLPTRCSVPEALKVAKLEWNVEVAEIEATLATGAKISGADHRVVVRSDTQEIFAACKHGYTPIQNQDVADLAFEISQQSDHAVETAGSIRGGRKMWFLLDIGTIAVANDDIVKPYLFICAGHDLSMRLTIGAIATRVVCANTVAMGLSEMNADTCVRIKHTASSATRLAMVKDWLAKPKAAVKAYGEQAIRMAEAGVTDAQLQAYFTSVWQRANGTLTANDVQDPKSRRSQKYANEVGQWLSNFRDDARQTGVSTKGTVWSAYNAITQYANHERTVRSEASDASRRVEGVLFGTAGDLNKAAYEAASALVS